jgi:hypothetical protein
MASGIAQKGRKEPWPKKILNYFKFNELSFFGQPLTTLVNICQPKTFTCESFHDRLSEISFTCERKRTPGKFHASLLGDTLCRTMRVPSRNLFFPATSALCLTMRLLGVITRYILVPTHVGTVREAIACESSN